MRLVLGALLASASAAALGPHVPGQVCHAWTRSYGCQPPPAVSVWPHPREMSVGTGPARSVGQDLELVCGEGAHQDDVLQLAMERYTAIIHGTTTREGVGLAEAAPPGGTVLTTLTVRVAGGDAVLNATKFAELDESYTLTVPATGSATLTAETTLGALRGLETFAQIIDYSSQTPQIAAVPVHISDEPRFSWRGLRIDSSRHFLPMGTIRAALDAMAAAKLNGKCSRSLCAFFRISNKRLRSSDVARGRRELLPSEAGRVPGAGGQGRVLPGLRLHHGRRACGG